MSPGRAFEPATHDWPQARWAAVLDRIEYRQNDVGLRFWGPPLWLEVTMTGPDSDRSAAVDAQSIESWNWESTGACPDASELVDAGAHDDHLLAAACRYTIENLILNSVHEIGEWLRFDGDRSYPPHAAFTRPDHARTSEPDQGNGTVCVLVTFPSAADTPAIAAIEDSGVARLAGNGPDDGLEDVSNTARTRLAGRLAGLATASRITYLPGIVISFDDSGPAITGPGSATERPTRWRATWSRSTLDAVDAPPGSSIVGSPRTCTARSSTMRPTGSAAPSMSTETNAGPSCPAMSSRTGVTAPIKDRAAILSRSRSPTAERRGFEPCRLRRRALRVGRGDPIPPIASHLEGRVDVSPVSAR